MSEHISDDQWKSIQWISIKDINLGIEHRINEWKIALKKVKVPARPKKTKSNDEILDEFLNDLNKEDLIKIIKIISTDDEIKKIKKDKFKETVTKTKEFICL
nr:hypothetical protein [Mycoplasmopsis bovis]